MISVSVLYPRQAGSRFDMDYYCSTHIPLCRKLLGAALKGVIVEQGVLGPTPGSDPSYMAIGQLRFDSVDAFQAAFGPAAKDILSDIPNYTNVQPVIQINEIKLF
jgi:uncharacterized protein (TIGR02118 family)